MKILLFVALTGACVLVACSDSTSPTSVIPVTGTLQFTDSTAAYVKLGTPSTVSTSADWDMKFAGTGVTLNGGSSGSGTVTGYCLCENASKSDAQFLALTATGTAAAFDSISASSIPSSTSAFVADSVTPAIYGWANGTTPVAANTYLVNLASTSGAQIKFSVTSFSGANSTTPGTVTLTYAYRATTTVEFGTMTTTTVTVPTTGNAYVSFAGGTPTVTPGTTAPTTWDIQFSGYKIFLNGGVSGTGGATVLPFLASNTSTFLAFSAITSAAVAPVPTIAYSSDAFGGVFASSNTSLKWYKYDINGTHLITPTFNTYLVSTTTGVYKVQVISYYNTAAIGQHITIRSAKIASAR